MSILGQEPITYRRTGAYTAGTDGRGVPGAVTTSTLYGSVQPMDGDDVQTLPEGERARRGRKVYTETEVRVTSQGAGTPGDQLYIDGEWWEARLVARQRSILPHYKVIVLAVQETEA